MTPALMLAIALGIYGLVIAVLAWILRRFRVPESGALFMSLLIFGAAAGILMMLLWPMDTSVYPNVFAAWAGDWIFAHAIEWIGDPHSDQAHFTIPWLLRVPQVYAVASFTGCGALGIITQWLFKWTVDRRGKAARQVSKKD